MHLDAKGAQPRGSCYKLEGNWSLREVVDACRSESTKLIGDDGIHSTPSRATKKNRAHRGPLHGATSHGTVRYTGVRSASGVHGFIWTGIMQRPQSPFCGRWAGTERVSG